VTAATAADNAARTFAANRARGHIGLTIASRRGRSHRLRTLEEGGLRVRFPNSGGLEAVFVNTAGGIAGGDRLSFDLELRDEAQLVATTAAAEKVYRAPADPAGIDVRIALGERASLSWVPQETILFDAARLTRAIAIDLAPTARVLLAESVVFGRTAMGETMASGTLSDRWRVRRGGRLLFADTLRLDGEIGRKLDEPAIGNGGCACATVLCSPVDEAAQSAIHDLAGTSAEIGVSAWNGVMLVRIVARSGEAMRSDLKSVLTALGVSLPRLWLN
jgi:urease accessory protein